MLTALLVMSQATAGVAADSPPGGFNISLVESGEVIVSDREVASFDWDHQILYLTPEGVERWNARAPRNPSFDPPTPVLRGSLHGKRFVVSVDGAEMYRGTIWSMASSLLQLGIVTLAEPLGTTPLGRLTLQFSPDPGSPIQDPRFRPEIRKYFEEQGRLRLADEATEEHSH